MANNSNRQTNFKLTNDAKLDRRYKTTFNSKVTKQGKLDGRCKNAKNTKIINHTDIKYTQMGTVDKRTSLVKESKLLLTSKGLIDGRSKVAKNLNYLNNGIY